jgi:hypothetical protein
MPSDLGALRKGFPFTIDVMVWMVYKVVRITNRCEFTKSELALIDYKFTLAEADPVGINKFIEIHAIAEAGAM